MVLSRSSRSPGKCAAASTTHAELERQLDNRGLMNRLLGGYANASIPRGRFIRSVSSSAWDSTPPPKWLCSSWPDPRWSEDCPFYAVLSLPILFAAGMCLFDALDGCFMNFAYDWAFAKPIRKIYYNLTITGLSVFVALLHRYHRNTWPHWPGNECQRRLLGVHAELQHQQGGFVIVGLFAVTWVAALGIWHFGQIERKWELEAGAARAEATPGPDYAGSGAGAESLPARD